MALTVQTDEQWKDFCKVLGTEELASDPRFITDEARLEHQSELESKIADAVRPWAAPELAAILQANGVPAGPVMDAADVFQDEHVKSRQILITAELAEWGPHEWVGPSWKFHPAPVTMRSASAGLGQHNEYVYRSVLGYTKEEYERLVETNAIGTEFDPSIP